jgi:TPR repeat protein
MGRGVETNYFEAAAWHRRSAEQGNPAGQYRLGHCFRSGRGVAQDEAEALNWFGKAAEAGLASAQNSCAWILATSTNASLRDGALAVAFAQKAVKATLRTNGAFLDTLAAALAEAGEFDQAVAIQKEAIAVEKDAKLKQDYAARLRHYEGRTPYREVPSE